VVEVLLQGGRLAAIGAVADTPALVVALDRAIGELKRAAVEPEALAAAVGRRRDKHADLVAVYRAYQRALQEQRACDEEGRMWLARDRLRAAAEAGEELPGLAGVRAVAADGFTDFTPTQLEILSLLASRLELVVVTLPWADDGRKRMWHWTGRTLDALRERFGAKLTEIECAGLPATQMPPAPAGAGPSGGLGALWRAVFDADAKCQLPPGFSVVGAAGADAEVAAAARRIKALLAGGQGGRVAVLARSLEGYREPIRRAFAACDVPVGPAAVPLTDVPVVRFLLHAAGISPDFAWRDVLAVVKSSYFRPGALGDFDEADVRAAERLIREGNVVGGREAYAEAGRRLAARAAADAAQGDRDDDADGKTPVAALPPEAVHRAAAMLDRLFDAAAAADTPAGLFRLSETLQLADAARQHDTPELVARDLRALTAVEAHLRDVPSPAPPPAAVRQALSAETCPSARGESLVDVLDVLDARALSYDHVFLLGVGERQFPPRQAETPFIGEAERAAWAATGVRLDARSDLTAREMLLFYLAVTRARRTLTMSYLEADARGQGGAPSPFLLSLLDTMGGLEELRRPREPRDSDPWGSPAFVSIPPGRFLLAPGEQPVARDEAFNAAFASLFAVEAATAPDLAAWAAREQAGRLLRASMGLLAAHRRWQGGECDEFDGRISDGRLRKSLRRRFGADALFSAAQLDTFGLCPWRFFATYVLKLEVPTEPQRRLEPATRGAFCHAVLCRLMRRLAGERGGVRLAEVAEADLSAALEEAVAAEAAAIEARRPPYPLLWQIQLDQLRRELRDYLREASRRAGLLSAEAVHFELAFGPQDFSRDADPASSDKPAAIATPAGKLLLRGRIDRVDRVEVEGARALLIIDYKTGRLPVLADVREGRNMQAPLYAAAVEQMLGEPCLGGAFHGIGGSGGPAERLYAAIDKARGRDAYVPNEGYAALREQVLAAVGRFVRAMREGRFDALPTHDCPSWCALRGVCQFSPVRAERKTRAPADQPPAGPNGGAP